MNERMKKVVEKIKKDCLALKKRNDLTEFGEGQLSLVYVLEENELD